MYLLEALTPEPKIYFFTLLCHYKIIQQKYLKTTFLNNIIFFSPPYQRSNVPSNTKFIAIFISGELLLSCYNFEEQLGKDEFSKMCGGVERGEECEMMEGSVRLRGGNKH